MLGIVFVWDVVEMIGIILVGTLLDDWDYPLERNWDYPLERKYIPGGGPTFCSGNWDVFNLCFLEFGNGVPLRLHKFVAAALAFALAALRTNSK